MNSATGQYDSQSSKTGRALKREDKIKRAYYWQSKMMKSLSLAISEAIIDNLRM